MTLKISIIELQQTLILQKLFDPILLVLNNYLISFLWIFYENIWVDLFGNFIDWPQFSWRIWRINLIFLKDWRRFTLIPLFSIILIRNYNYLFFPFIFQGGGLNRTVPAFFAFSLVHLTYCVYFFDDLMINCDSFLRIKGLFLQHRYVKHFVLYF